MGSGSSRHKATSQTSEEPRKTNIIETQTQTTTQQILLPHKYEDIVKDADSPIDNSSIDKLYDQLYAGVFLNRKRKASPIVKYWVERKSNNNCFMLFARDLLITWSDDIRYWHWTYLNETSDVLIDVAELLDVCWLEVRGKFQTVKLSQGIMYEVVFVVMLKDPAYGWEVPVILRLTLPDGSTQEHKENLMEKPRGRWIEIPVGEFRTTAEKVGDIGISLCGSEGGNWKRGLVIKGVSIRPKT
ncbi:hypothetical protein F0562_019511 [Nyssa sinensis]|uniref:Uncharacterized protein n=1 Tax=Nyssa sinensis TaxID=561372 RepID=A0A5J5BP39_9ASTE|nr:hypothetical protein F0562_019511 [Nyssa sinensis]